MAWSKTGSGSDASSSDKPGYDGYANIVVNMTPVEPDGKRSKDNNGEKLPVIRAKLGGIALHCDDVPFHEFLVQVGDDLHEKYKVKVELTLNLKKGSGNLSKSDYERYLKR